MNRAIRKLLGWLNLNVRIAPVSGLSFLKYNFFRDIRASKPKDRSHYAINYVLKINPKTVLDVGSGGGEMAEIFSANGADVTCVDYGTSIYAKSRKEQSPLVINMDFNEFTPIDLYDLVWASHVLEHQRNPGTFLEKVLSCCKPAGVIVITVPDPHKELWGGHLTLWTPRLLAYNIVMCGVDLSNSIFIRGTNEFSIAFKPIRVELPKNLTYDNGDLEILSGLMPRGTRENMSQWSEW